VGTAAAGGGAARGDSGSDIFQTISSDWFQFFQKKKMFSWRRIFVSSHSLMDKKRTAEPDGESMVLFCVFWSGRMTFSLCFIEQGMASAAANAAPESGPYTTWALRKYLSFIPVWP
jgi:hypothetical protein